MTARPLAALGLVAAVAASGCETTQAKSARLERDGAAKAQTGTLDLAARTNRSVQAGTPTVLRGDGVSAVVVPLRNTGSTVQAGVPIALEAFDAKGRSLYRNDLDGLQTSLQQMASLRPGERAYWVNDQVTATGTPASVGVEVGTPARPAPAAIASELQLERVATKDDVSGAFLGGVVRSRGKTVLKKVPVYAVALKGGEVVAAGRSIVEQVDPEPVKKPAVFRIYFVGDPKGADIDVRAHPAPPPDEEPTP